ncbi:reverse transcriptase [Fadolivirus algeromassiliense]|jgi:hypothetical protein|uniref:Reverse transcriptase n=1 Tax=Fadolivirus FV1/VV64 TaxID=3070911 RepID=A0A7D3V7V7_9VIRU|nr:reverse transcriptase [Fadolivirus algeromassiliense]QKF94516.1 reverse transcriptase [Fadolivirus FV1/VV64]
MGNYTSYLSGSTTGEFTNVDNQTNVNQMQNGGEFDPVDFSHFDEMTKDQLVNYIKLLKPKQVNLPDDMTDKMKNMEIENSELMPMAIELYQKMLDTFGEYKPTQADKNHNKKKVYFVRPKFDADVVKKTLNEPVQNISTPLDTTLVQPTPSIVSMKMDDITVDEFTNSFNNTLSKKDMIGINKRMLRDMPQYMKQRFVNTYNKVLSDHSKVNNLSVGKGSYVYKASKHGSTSDINSFRQIISLPNVATQLHRILALRLNNYMQANKYIDTTIQKGGVSGQKFAIFEQYYKVKSILKHANQNKKSCAVLFLDISNAFGNIDLQNLYSVLKLYNVDQNFTNYVREFYSKFEYYIDTANIKTDTFKWKNGLVQGDSMSPLLFIIALNYVLTHVDNQYKSTHGYAIDDKTSILLTAFVDDICIICKDLASLEIVYKRLKELLTMLGLPINKSKCAVMVANDNSTVTGDLATIQKVNVFKYLGEYVSSDGSCTESYVQFLRGLSRKCKSIDGKAIPTNEKLKLFETVVVPWIHRKTLAMYDISMTNRLKIVAVLKPYLEGWGHAGVINIFSNVMPILNDSKDAVISNVRFEDTDFDDELEQNIEVANYVLKDANIKVEYSQIDDEFTIDAELEEYDQMVDE